MQKGPYKILSSRHIYKNPWMTVKEDTVVKPDGKKGIFGVVDFGEGISIVALNSKNEVYMVKEYYYAISKQGLQLPSGSIDGKETPLQAAKRELLEETGVQASRWISLGFIHPLTMILKSKAYLYLALNVKKKQKVTDATIKVIKLPFGQVFQMVVGSKITHSPSCVGILRAGVYLKKI